MSIRSKTALNRSRAAGFSLLTALFLLVVVAGIGGYLVNLSVTQHLGSALAGHESRAYYAALSGLEWVNARISGGAGCPDGSSFNVGRFTVFVDCEEPIDEVEATPYQIHDVTVEAVSGNFGDWDYTRRSIRATLSEVSL